MENQILQGQCKVENITLNNLNGDWVDLTNICTNVKIYESIEDVFCHGRLSIVDGLDLLKNYKIIGQESLTIRIRALDQTETDGWTNLENSIDIWKELSGRLETDKSPFACSICDKLFKSLGQNSN